VRRRRTHGCARAENDSGVLASHEPLSSENDNPKQLSEFQLLNTLNRSDSRSQPEYFDPNLTLGFLTVVPLIGVARASSS
jgi:hypothetical protein